MADLTPGRKPVDDAAARIKRRRRELDLHNMRGQVLLQEIEISEYEDQIKRRRDAIAATQERISALETELKQEITSQE